MGEYFAKFTLYLIHTYFQVWNVINLKKKVMIETNKSIVTPKWLEIKNHFEKNTNGSKEYGTNFEIEGEFDTMCSDFIDLLSQITLKFGFKCRVEDIDMDLWKDRVWVIYEKAGLLAPIAWKTDKEEKSFEELLKEDQEWLQSSESDEFDIDIESIQVEIFK